MLGSLASVYVQYKVCLKKKKKKSIEIEAVLVKPEMSNKLSFHFLQINHLGIE